MLEGVDRLKAHLDRVRKPRKATITPGPGLPPVEVGLGDEVEVVYAGERRRVRILAVEPWGIRVRDLDKEAVRAFAFSKIGVAAEEEPAAE